jgi:hypothetical protein
VAIAAGWAVMAWAVVGVLRDATETHPGSWLIWVVGAAVIHDAVVLPVVAATGWWLIGRLPDAWRAPARTALVVGAVVALVSFPVVAAFGARPDNPSLLPLPAGRNLVVVLAAVLVAALLAGLWGSRQGGGDG